MNNQEIVICDLQEAYISALLSYLIKKFPKVRIKTFTKVELFEEFLSKTILKQYECLILGSEFISSYENNKNKIRVNNIYQFCREGESTVYEPLYKFQSTEQLIMKIMKEMEFLNDAEKSIEVFYSPINKNMTFPYALKRALELKNSGTVLFVDFEEINYLRLLLDIQPKYNVMDILYYLAQQPNTEKRMIGDFTTNYEGVDIIAAPNNPVELSLINENEIQNLISYICESNYQKIVFVFNEVSEMMTLLLKQKAKLTILTKAGAYANEIVKYVENALDITDSKRKNIDVEKTERMLEYGFESFRANYDMEWMTS